MKVLFIRHGQTNVNVQSKVHNQNDEIGLDEIGVQQAHKVAEVCFRENIDELYCSPEKRAVQTAEAIGAMSDLTPNIVQQLGERRWGDWSGRPWSEIEARLIGMDLNQRYNFIPPNGESWRAMDIRLKQVVSDIVSSGASTIAIVTHGGALRALMPILKNDSKQTSFQYNFANASITSFDYDGTQWKLRYENSVAHLD